MANYPGTIFSTSRKYRDLRCSNPKSPTAIVQPIAAYRQAKLVPGTMNRVNMGVGSNSMVTVNGHGPVLLLGGIKVSSFFDFREEQ